MLLATILLAMVLVTAAPAVAQVGQGFSERDVKAGAATPTFSVKQEPGAAGAAAPAEAVAPPPAEAVTPPPAPPKAAAPAPAPTPPPPPVPAPAQAKAGGAEAKAAPKEAKALPPTGGVASATAAAWGLSVGVLLMAGGLLARKIVR